MRARSVTPKPAQQPNPSLVADALEAEKTVPPQVAVSDFAFDTSSVRESASPLHRGADLFKSSSADQRRIEIADDAAATLSKLTAKRLDKVGLPAVRIASDSDAPLYNNTLLVTGRLIDVDEGNRFTRIALGFGAGESRLDTEVHVFRVVEGEKAEVLTFTTHADSGKMPGFALAKFAPPSSGSPDDPRLSWPALSDHRAREGAGAENPVHERSERLERASQRVPA